MKKLNKKKYEEVVKEYQKTDKKTDPNGSYTGTPEDKKKPVQDADDL